MEILHQYIVSKLSFLETVVTDATGLNQSMKNIGLCKMPLFKTTSFKMVVFETGIIVTSRQGLTLDYSYNFVTNEFNQTYKFLDIGN